LATHADVFTRADFTLVSGAQANQYEFIAEYPIKSNSQLAIVWPPGCSAVHNKQFQSVDSITQTYLIKCDLPLARGDIIKVPYRVDAAIFNLQLGAMHSRTIAASSPTGAQLILQTGEPPVRKITSIAADYLYQGAIHIWFGWDHLAFVFCLCLLAVGMRHLFWTITAFTIGHSVSMALSFFKLVNIAISPIEAIIALSIVLMAREAWLNIVRDNKAEHLRTTIVVTLFGLIHGLGFASALENIGVAQQERVAALAFFNLGVEAGQIIFVAAIFALLAVLRKFQLAQKFSYIGLLLVGTAGCFWTFERISGFNW
jgi:hypothetical protein